MGKGYTICLHNATAAVARLEDDLHSTLVKVDQVFRLHENLLQQFFALNSVSACIDSKNPRF